MGMYDSPQPPPAPDYAAANRAGVEANAEMMPLLIAIDRAARAGTTYTDPSTGKVYDFSQYGGDRALLDMDIDAQKRLLEAGATLSRDLERGRANDMLELLPRYNELNIDAQRRAMEEGLRLSGDFTRNQYEQDLAYRPRFGDLQRSEDAKTWEQNLRLGEQGTRRMADLQNDLLPDLNRAGLRAQTEAEQARLDALRTTDPERWAMRQKMLSDANSELAAGGAMSPEQRRRFTEAIRGAQAVRGNTMGDAAAFDEALQLTGYGDQLQQQRRANALSVLQAGELGPRFNAAQPVNPLLPNYQSTQAVNPTVPGLQATTAAGPDLSPANIGRSNPLQYMNTGMGHQGADYARSVWQTQAQIKSQEMNPWMAGLSLGIKGFSAFKPGGWGT